MLKRKHTIFLDYCKNKIKPTKYYYTIGKI